MKNNYEKLKGKISKKLADKNEVIKTLTKENEDLKNRPPQTQVIVEKLVFPDEMEMHGEVEVKNQIKEVAINNLPEIQKVSGEVHIANLPEVQKIVGEVSIANLPELPEVQKVEGAIEITNFPDPEKQPTWIAGIFTDFFATLSKLLTKIANKTFTTKLAEGERQKPQLVVVIGEDGKVMDFKRPINIQAGRGSGPSVVGLKNTNNQAINPMTEETGDTILSTLQNFESENGISNETVRVAISKGLAQYRIHDISTNSGDPLVSYYGFADSLNNWYILQENNDDPINPTYRYAGGNSNINMDYGSAWNNREGLGYDYIFNITIPI
ncbi:MAG: hypothetical protein NTX85_03240 [Candidatus Nomurabacteria bacterium]|nr:hypothetical protein [Candidatus Nomurabacteria bacterium]MCX6788455.1 hypothetical protein [Candidatus Jorgensenbacteria bacterium]